MCTCSILPHLLQLTKESLVKMNSTCIHDLTQDHNPDNPCNLRNLHNPRNTDNPDNPCSPCNPHNPTNLAYNLVYIFITSHPTLFFGGLRPPPQTKQFLLTLCLPKQQWKSGKLRYRYPREDVENTPFMSWLMFRMNLTSGEVSSEHTTLSNS